MARTAIQSDLFKNKVAKLTYFVRGTYQILHNTGLGSYFVQKITNLTALNSSSWLVIFISFLRASQSTQPTYAIWTIPMILSSTLWIFLHIELYNEKWFNKPVPTKDSSFTYNHDTLKFLDKFLLPFPSVLELHNETNTCSPKPLLATEDYSLSPPPSPPTLHNSLTDSDCVFFVQYLPENTVKSCWGLVQINHIETEILNINFQRVHVITMLRLSRDIQTIIIFVTTKLVGVLCGTNIKIIRMVYLSMVIVWCLDRSANPILTNTSFGQIPLI